MFDKFGEFDSAEEINRAAAGLKEEGDLQGLKELAGENGIEEAFADMYMQGAMPFLCDVTTAAIGKLTVEAGEVKPVEIMEDWTEYIKASCMEDEALAAAVRRKGKSLKDCIAALLTWGFKHQHDVPKDVMKAAGVSASKCTLGIPGMGTAKRLIREYYVK